MAAINDLVLVHIDHKPGFYARVEDIVPDVKPGWWQVKLLVLTFPLQLYTWILDESQINGAPYTMGGTPIRLETLVSPVVREESRKDGPVEKEASQDGASKGAKVVPLFQKETEKERQR